MFRSAKIGMKTGRYVWNVRNGKLLENTVLLESKNAKDLAGNIFRILQELDKEEYSDLEVYLSVRRGCEGRVRRLTQAYGIGRFKFVRYASKEYYRLLATAKYLVEDTTFPDKFIKREDQVYLNTWHGTPWKMMGKDEEVGAYAIGNVQKNFLYADYLLYPNEYMKSVMFKAYMLEDLYRGTVLYEGYPRNSIFFDNDKYKEMRQTLDVADKQVIVYMPTWRGGVNKSNATVTEEACACYFDVLDELLTDDQVFYVKFHLFAANSFQFDDYQHIKPFPSGYEPYEVLNAADVLVTDYSSVFFDFANTGRKIILFPYDYEEYLGKRGLYTQMDELPFPIVYTATDLAAEINSPKAYDDTEFMNTFCKYDNPDATRRLVRQVFRGESVCETIDYAAVRAEDKRKKILLYSAGMDRNGLSTALLNLMKEADTTNNCYYFAFFQGSFKRDPRRISRIPANVNFIPLNGTVTDLTLLELIAFKLFYGMGIDCKWVQRYVRRLYAREYEKHYAGTKFDGIIHFTGYNKEVTMMYLTAPCKKAIFVHSDMLKEIATRNNHHLPTLRYAYHEYDYVVPVSDSVHQAILPIADPDRIVVIENTHDDAGVKEKAQQELVFDNDTRLNIPEEEVRALLDNDEIEKFISVGRFSPEKGHKKLIEAFDRYHSEHPDTALIIIGGNGAYYNETLRFTNELACADSVVLIRSMSNPFPVVNRCKLFLLSSEYEALGLVLLEAESLGIPTISTDVPGSGDLMKKYGGYVVDNSPEGLYQGMCAYREGKVHTMGISFEDYNQASIRKFDTLFEE